jgi:hypothetical protein
VITFVIGDWVGQAPLSCFSVSSSNISRSFQFGQFYIGKTNEYHFMSPRLKPASERSHRIQVTDNGHTHKPDFHCLFLYCSHGLSFVYPAHERVIGLKQNDEFVSLLFDRFRCMRQTKQLKSFHLLPAGKSIGPIVLRTPDYLSARVPISTQGRCRYFHQ